MHNVLSSTLAIQSPAPSAEALAWLSTCRIKLFADGADLQTVLDLAERHYIRGFTTNPSLMRQAGVTHYERFAQEVLQAVMDKPVSFEVLSDDFEGMRRQALKIAAWGKNVYVKIPVTNSRGESSAQLIRQLSQAGIKVNVTAVLTLEQVQTVGAALASETPAIISVFAGRVADTGRDPVQLMHAAAGELRERPNVELLWASPRELLNLFQAETAGCHIITATQDVLKKLAFVGRDLAEYSLETVNTFLHDARAAGYAL